MEQCICKIQIVNKFSIEMFLYLILQIVNIKIINLKVMSGAIHIENLEECTIFNSYFYKNNA